jgi:hypothetical protein
MADKSPRKASARKAGKTLKQKRVAKKRKRDRVSGLLESIDQRRP